MKKNLNKAMAVIAAAGMCSSACVYAMPSMMTIVNADNSETAHTTTISVSGLTVDKSDVTVTAYQIVKGTYDNGKLTGYEAVNATVKGTDSFKGLSNGTYTADETNGKNNINLLSSGDITAIANDIEANPNGYTSYAMTVDADNGTATSKKAVKPGLYMILVSNTGSGEGASSTVYNPAVVAVNASDANITKDSDLTTTALNMDSAFGSSKGTAYLKKSTSGFDKNITADTGESDSRGSAGTKGIHGANGKSKADDVAVGDVVTFTLDGMTIPSYSKDYDTSSDNAYDITYKVTDTLSDGLDFVTTGSGDSVKPDITVKNGAGETINADNYEIEYTNGSRTFDVKFKDSYLTSLEAEEKSSNKRQVVITLKAKVNENANVIGGSGSANKDNTNTAQLDYSNNGTDASNVKTIKKTTHMYTFGVDIKKLGADNAALAGAKFSLYRDSGCTSKIMDSTSGGADGISTFTGLDSNDAGSATAADKSQVYYLKETTAPAGYTLNNTVYQITITPTIDSTNNVLQSYTVTYAQAGSTAPAATQTYNATAGNAGTNGIVTYTLASEKGNADFTVSDTKLFNLPSTGERTALISTVLGAAGITIAIVMKKKKDEKDEAEDRKSVV